MTRKGVLGVLGLFMGLAVACGGESTPPAQTAGTSPPPPPPAATGTPGETAGCPTDLAGMQVAVAEVTDGIALTFTDPKQEAAARSRVHWLVERQNEAMKTCPCASAQHHAGGPPTVVGMPTVASTASAEDVAGGGKLVLVAKNQGEALALRQEVKDRLVAMQHGQCPIL